MATLRTLRELHLQDLESPVTPRFGSNPAPPWELPPRAWDLALWNGVSVQGAANSLERLHRNGLVRRFSYGSGGGAARYELDHGSDLVRSLCRLFDTEWSAADWRGTPGRPRPAPAR